MLELLRQLEIFSPYAFQDKRIDVIGAGATGSHVVLLLAKIGMQNIHVWDDDAIASHNIPNQCFNLSQVGVNKVDALAEVVFAATGVEIARHLERVESPKEFGPIVFLLVDTMEGRKKIWNDSLKFKFGIECAIETRMGADSGRIYTIDPRRPSHIKAWEATLYEDSAAVVSACGATSSIAPTAMLVASLAVWQMIKFLNGDDLENEILVSTRPLTTFGKVW